MQYGLPLFLLLVAVTAHAVEPGDMINGTRYQISPDDSGAYVSSGGFRTGSGPSAPLTSLPSGPSMLLNYSQKLNDRRESWNNDVHRAAKNSSLHQTADDVPQVRPELEKRDLANPNGNTLDWGEKINEAKSILEIGRAGLNAESLELSSYIKKVSAWVENDIQRQEALDFLEPRQKALNDTAKTFGAEAKVYEKAGRAMARDMHEKESKGSSFTQTTPAPELPQPNERKPGDPKTPKQKIEELVNGLSPKTTDFLEDQGIDPKDYAAAYLNGELSTSEGMNSFFENNGSTLDDCLQKEDKNPEALLAEIEARYGDINDTGDEDLRSRAPRGDKANSRAFTAKDSRAREVTAYDDGAHDQDKISEGEKRSLLGFVEDWWKSTSGKKGTPQARAFTSRKKGQRGLGQNVSPSTRPPLPRRTIFDVAGDAYRRAQTS